MLSKTSIPKAKAVLELLAAVLRAQGNDVKEHPENLSSWLDGLPLEVNGIGVRLAIREGWTQGFSPRPTGTLFASIESVTGWLNSQQFRQAKSRAKTYGFDIPAMAEGVLRYVDACAKEKTRVDGERNALAHAEADLASLRSLRRWPEALMRHLKPTRQGLLFQAVVDRETAMAILQAMSDKTQHNPE